MTASTGSRITRISNFSKAISSTLSKQVAGRQLKHRPIRLLCLGGSSVLAIPQNLEFTSTRFGGIGF